MSELTSLVVRKVTHEADNVLGLTLGHPDEEILPAWAPGAHLDLLLKQGLVRQYSLCGDVTDRYSYRIAVLLERDGRGGSEYVHRFLSEGDEVAVRGPKNHFRLVESDRYLFIAGGIGITPILPMVKQVAQAGAEFSVLYGGRRRATMAFRDQLNEYGSRVRFVPEDREGPLNLVEALGSLAEGTQVYCCGPEGLIAAVEQLCSHTYPHALHVERFAARPSGAPRMAHPRANSVTLARSGLELSVPPERSILDVVLQAGVEVPYDCVEGICGSCEVKVLEGEIEHMDEVLTKQEKESNTVMMICCSRSRGPRIVLDL